MGVKTEPKKLTLEAGAEYGLGADMYVVPFRMEVKASAGAKVEIRVNKGSTFGAKLSAVEACVGLSGAITHGDNELIGCKAELGIHKKPGYPTQWGALVAIQIKGKEIKIYENVISDEDREAIKSLLPPGPRSDDPNNNRHIRGRRQAQTDSTLGGNSGLPSAGSTAPAELRPGDTVALADDVPI